MAPTKKTQINKTEEKTQTLTNKLVETFGKTEISEKTKDILTRTGTYSLNYFPGLLSKIYNAPTEIGNAYGAICFAALDVLARKNTIFKRLAKTGGYLWYVGEGIYDLALALTDRDNVWAHLGNFSLDVTMAYQLGKDMGSLYKKAGEDSDQDKKFGISKDLEKIVSFIKKKFPPEKEKDTSEKSNKAIKIKLKKYLSAFGNGALITIKYGASVGKSALTGISYGFGSGFGFGKSAFEKLNENYSVYRKEQKEKSEANKKIKKEKAEEKAKQNELKKIKDEEIRQEKANKKIINVDLDKISLEKEKEILERLLRNKENIKRITAFYTGNELTKEQIEQLLHGLNLGVKTR